MDSWFSVSLALFFTGITIVLTFEQLSNYKLPFLLKALLVLLTLVSYDRSGALFYLFSSILILAWYFRKKEAFVTPTFYFLYAFISLMIFSAVLERILGFFKLSIATSLGIETFFLPWFAYLLQLLSNHYLKDYLRYFSENILKVHFWQALIIDLIFISYIFLRFSNLTNKELISSITLGGVIVYIYLMTLYSQSEEMLKSKEAEINNLIEYTFQVENLYTELKYFKHDYKNILLSLEYALDHNDLTSAKAIYARAIAPTKHTINSELSIIGQLQNVIDPAIKGLIASKLILAVNKKLKVSIEISDPLKLSPLVDQLDLVRILAILLDNALEAAELSVKKELSFAFFTVSDTQYILIKNSTNEKQLDLWKILHTGYTTKGVSHGNGLAVVRKLLNKYPFIALDTSSNNYYFTQELSFTLGPERTDFE